ncbi:MAG TPA: LysR family transcriptional regulator [Caulobacteraceae bacterium]|nr:LysR family transcriptional regulator [Caulobacteraceae bacterium]
MELRHIRYFLAVAEERHFTRAAAKVGIGQPPLSQQIKDLEVEIGAPLFHRLAHGAELTPAGEAFLNVVKEMPGLAERAAKAARRAARGETGSLRVGFTAASAFNEVVPGTIRAFRRAYADVDLWLEEANTTRLVAGLRDGSLDAAFLRPGAVGSEAFQLSLLSEAPMVAALPANHRSATGQEVDLADLKTESFLMFPRPIGPTLYDSIIDACRKAGFDPVIGQLAPQIASVITLVAAELGVSIVPASMSRMRIPGVAYCAIAGEAPIARLALAHRRGETSPVVRNFIARAAAPRLASEAALKPPAAT